MRIFTSLFACTFLLFQINVCCGQTQGIFFNRVLPPEGNFFGTIGGIAQDPKGYIWIASTVNGLFRYDGHEMINYKHEMINYKNEANPNSLSNNWVESMYVDSAGIVWLGTWGSGLDRFDPATGIFTHYSHDPKNPSSLAQNLVPAIYEDKEGELWIGTQGGLDLMDRKNGTFKHYRHDPNDLSSLSNDQVRIIYEDKQGALWVGTGNPWLAGSTSGRPGEAGILDEGGLNRLDRRTGKFIRYIHDDKDPHSLAKNKVRALFEDSHGNFWVGTTGEDGLQIMDRTKGTFQRYAYDPLHPDKLSRPPVNKEIGYDHISFITEDAAGAIWIGTAGAGINRYDPVTQTIKHYSDRDSTIGFTGSSAWAHYTSRDGMLWISNFEGQLYRIDLFHTSIPHFNIGRRTNAFFEDGKGSFWIGTDSGVIQKDSNTGKMHLFSNDSLKNITWTIRDSSDNIWIGTFGGGFYKFDPGTQTFTNYRHNEKNKNTVVSNEVNCLYSGSGGNIWIGTSRGFDAMNIKTGKFAHYRNDNGDSVNVDFNSVQCLYEDKQGKIWTGISSGVTRLDNKTGKVKYYAFSNGIFPLYQDSEGDLWASSGDGFYKYDRNTDYFSPVINPATGKELGPVASMVEDDQKNIWITSITGLIKFNKQQNTFLTYGTDAGISNVNGATAYKDSKGQLYFSSQSGYYSFEPGKIVLKSKPPGILLNGFRISNLPVQPGENSPLDKPLWESNEIKLNYNQNVLSFEYAVIDFNNPAQNQGVYMLENYDKEWRPGGANGRADYFNLPPGKYIFKIRAVNSNGIQSEKSISIIISPPWWRTWWAYCIYAIFIALAAYTIHRIQEQNVIRAERERTKDRELAQAKEIEKAYHELKTTQTQLVQSEKMASLGELTAGIAHEIQNPLNFVNNFSEVNTELIDELKTELTTGNNQQALEIANNLRDNEQKIVFHGKRADAIVKSMLQHSRTNTGQKEFTDINALADEYLRLAYHGLRAKDKSFNASFKTDFDDNIEKINVIPQDVGRAMLNLINNAFYAVSEKKKENENGYEPGISVSTKKSNSMVEIKVRDNGNGIPKKVLDKIFQPFFTTKPTGQGTGLGLSLSYDIIKAHGGEIKVETREGEGSEFVIQLPIV